MPPPAYDCTENSSIIYSSSSALTNGSKFLREEGVQSVGIFKIRNTYTKQIGLFTKKDKTKFCYSS